MAAGGGLWVNLLNARIAERDRITPPSVDIRYDGARKLVSVLNNSRFPITELNVYITAYTFGLLGPTVDLMGRSASSGPAKSTRELGEGKELTVDEHRLLFEIYPQDLTKYNRVWALTVTFKRHSDGKQFCRVEPYFVAPIEGSSDLIVMFLRGPGTASTGVWGAKLPELLQKIEQRERYSYGVSDP